MSLTRSIAHNTIIQVIGRVVSTALTLVVFFFVARHLGVSQYGELTTATAFLQLFGLVVDLGLYIFLARSLGEPGANVEKITSDVFTLRIVSAVLIVGVAPLLVIFFPYSLVVKMSVAVLALSTVAVTVTQSLSGIFQYSLRTSRLIGSEVLGRIVLLLATLIAIHFNVGVVGITLTVTLGSVVTFIATLVAARRIVPLRFRIDLQAWWSILRETWPIALSIAFNVVYFKADTIILSLYHSSRDVGIYGAPYRFLEALISVPAMIAGLFTPLLAAAYMSDRIRFGRLLQRGFELLLFAALPITIGAQFVSNDLMRLVAPEFSAAGPVLRLLVIATFAIFLGYLFSNAVIVVRKQRTIVWAYGLVAVLSLILYFAFIPRYSYYGAAGVTIGVETLIALISAAVVLRTSRVRLSFGPTVRILLAGSAMAIVMWLGRDLFWVVNGVMGVVAYALASYVFRVFDRAVLSEVFSRRAP